jgi:hypothetical protein
MERLQTKYEQTWIIYTNMNFKDEHIIDGMIFSQEIDKWVTIEEYIEYEI